MNIDCENLKNILDDSEDYFRKYFQNLWYCELFSIFFMKCELVEKIIHTDLFWEATNIRKKSQNDSSEFEGLLHKMMSKKPFINQEISYINIGGRMKLSTMSNYIKDFSSIIEIEKEKCHICYNKNTPFEIFSDKLVLSLDGLNTPNLPWKIDHPNYTTFT